MLISTIFLIGNIISLIINGSGFIHFAWFLLFYPIEILIYIFLWIIGIASMVAIGRKIK